MANPDYYKVLGVPPEATKEDIRKAFRKLAFQTHPDRNAGNPAAEEQFKRINEAYAILADEEKRLQYDQFRTMGYHRQTAGGARGSADFARSQEDILRAFQGGRMNDIFEEMRREFERMGVRFDDRFFNDIFTGNQGRFYQQAFWSGPGGVHVFRYGKYYQPGQQNPGAQNANGPGQQGVRKEPRGLLSTGLSLLWQGVKTAGRYLAGKVIDAVLPGPGQSGKSGKFSAAGRPGGNNGDVLYQISIPTEHARQGGIVEVMMPHLEGGKRVSVRIPPGVRSGTRLRLREMGRDFKGNGRPKGDAYLEVHVK